MPKDKIQYKSSDDVQGSEGLNISVDYQNTTLETVVVVQYAKTVAYLKVIRKQAKDLGVSLEGLD